ncbi:hypothetical protein [Paraburkholderia diazotrophica]|uniref:Uncharacterized protein n=1 Tax=Paraburkholderia diazotrophica TaxID=667676 RepID=A0A1H7CST9_9BURK|nr:hypothetical protein [Paraburkholderia diazotrophica]SEJ92566.1 hypothetical protein SAMN05192539_102417 [Paraburkholderia diazotrophica]
METKLTAHLPTVDVEITRRKLPDLGAESIAIHITAVPTVEAAAQWFLQPSLFSLMSPLMSPVTSPLMSPISIWAMWMRAWQPWLGFVAAPGHAAQAREKRLPDDNAASGTH